MSIQLNPARVAQIQGGLYRGNFPLKGRDVDFEQLAALTDQGDRGIVEVCLTDNTGELDLLEILERTYGASFTRVAPPFQDPNYRHGAMYQQSESNRWVVWWPIEGGTTPDVTGPGQQSYNFVGLINFLQKLTAEDSRRVYVHCMNGTDRTGAVAAGYAIKAMGMNLKQAMDFAASVKAAGVMSQPYQDLVAWYSKLAAVVQL
jgi:protein-tyrosine phosphatase